MLVEHDFDRATAEPVVALRYGPLGPSFREAVRRIFAGVLTLRSDALRFVPTLQVFLARHPPQRFGRMEVSIFAEIQAADDARAAVLELVHGLDRSALQLEVAHFAAMVGWLERAELHALAAAAATELLQRPLSAESVDVMCEIVKYESLRDDIDADDFAAHHFADPQGLRMSACLAPADPRVAARLLPSLRGNDPVLRPWAACAVMQVRPSDPEILAALEPYRSDPSPEVATRIAWLLDTQARQAAVADRH